MVPEPKQPAQHPSPARSPSDPAGKTAVCCSRCNPPQRVEVPARIFYRLKDHELISCPNGHQGTLLDYKRAASEMAVAHGPFIRYDPHPADWLSTAEDR